MGFYLSYSSDISKRKAKCVFYVKDSSLFDIRNTEALSSLSDNFIKDIISYSEDKNITTYEILLPLMDNDSFKDVCNTISNYLLDKDITIGLLSDDPHFIDNNIDIIREYGVTCIDRDYRPVLRMCKSPISRQLGASLDVGSVKDNGLYLDESFHDKFLRLLIECGKDNVDVYRDGGITRQVFSNILSNKCPIPKKETIICLIIGMELMYQDALDLLASAGYTLSRSIASDAVVMKYLKEEVFDLYIINNLFNK